MAGVCPEIRILVLFVYSRKVFSEGFWYFVTEVLLCIYFESRDLVLTEMSGKIINGGWDDDFKVI